MNGIFISVRGNIRIKPHGSVRLLIFILSFELLTFHTTSSLLIYMTEQRSFGSVIRSVTIGLFLKVTGCIIFLFFLDIAKHFVLILYSRRVFCIIITMPEEGEWKVQSTLHKRLTLNLNCFLETRCLPQLCPLRKIGFSFSPIRLRLCP